MTKLRNHLTAWFVHVVYYVPNRRKGWTHDDLAACRRIAGKIG